MESHGFVATAITTNTMSPVHPRRNTMFLKKIWPVPLVQSKRDEDAALGPNCASTESQSAVSHRQGIPKNLTWHNAAPGSVRDERLLLDLFAQSSATVF